MQIDPKVQRSIDSVRAFHRQGRRILKTRPDGHSGKAIRQEAKRQDTSVVTLYKARSFAQEYAHDELEALCRLCQKHRYPITLPHIIVLLSVPKEKRQKLQRQVIENHWSTRRLKAEIFRLFGRIRRDSGRTCQMPQDRMEAYFELRRLCGRLEHYCEVLDKPQGRSRRTVLERLPVGVRKRLAGIRVEMKELGGMLFAALAGGK